MKFMFSMNFSFFPLKIILPSFKAKNSSATSTKKFRSWEVKIIIFPFAFKSSIILTKKGKTSTSKKAPGSSKDRFLDQ